MIFASDRISDYKYTLYEFNYFFFCELFEKSFGLNKGFQAIMPTTCEIDFDDNPMKIIFAGELLCGTVRLRLTKEQNIRTIFIRIYGHASVRMDNSTRCSNRQTYLNKKIILARGNNG